MNELMQLRRKRTEKLSRLSPRPGRFQIDAFDPEEAPPRPTRRADCVDGPRPCPWVSCRHHLAIEAKLNGNLELHAPDDGDGGLELDALAETCSLDVADQGALGLAELGEQLGVIPQRAQQLVVAALERVARMRPELRDEAA